MHFLHLFVLYVIVCVCIQLQEIYRFAGQGIQCAPDLCLHYIAVVFIVNQQTIIYLFIFVYISSPQFVCLSAVWCVIIIIRRLQ